MENDFFIFVKRIEVSFKQNDKRSKRMFDRVYSEEFFVKRNICWKEKNDDICRRWKRQEEWRRSEYEYILIE